MASTDNMSREEKEALLNIRMEQIRKKNAELMKRYEEVQADKQNAETISDEFQESRRSLAPTEPATMAAHITKPKLLPKNRRQQENDSQPRVHLIHQHEKFRIHQRLSEEDGPPPDPSYRFLADSSREGDEPLQQDKRGGSRRHAGNYGGENFDNVKVSIEKRRNRERTAPWHPPQNKMELSLRMTGKERREYDQWKRERSKIEQDRINRQKTASGEWRREWDREKFDVDESLRTTPASDRLPEDNRNRGDQWIRGNKNRRGSGRAVFRGIERSQSYQESPAKDNSKMKEETNTTRVSETSNVWRRVEIKDDDSITMSISNDFVNKKSSMTVSTSCGITSRNGENSTLDNKHSETFSDTHMQKIVNKTVEEVISQGSLKSHDDKISSAFEEKEITDFKNTASKSSKTKSKVSLEEFKIVSEQDVDEWDDEGSWEDATTSENESQDCSQYDQSTHDNEETGIEIAEEALSAAIDANYDVESVAGQSNSRESTPKIVEEATKIIQESAEQQCLIQNDSISGDISKCESQSTSLEIITTQETENDKTSSDPVGDATEKMENLVDSAGIDLEENSLDSSVVFNPESDRNVLESESVDSTDIEIASEEIKSFSVHSTEMCSDRVALDNLDDFGNCLVESTIPDSEKVLLENEALEKPMPDSTECDSTSEPLHSSVADSALYFFNQTIDSIEDFISAEVVEISVADSTTRSVTDSRIENEHMREDNGIQVQEVATSEDMPPASISTNKGDQQHTGILNNDNAKENDASDEKKEM